MQALAQRESRCFGSVRRQRLMAFGLVLFCPPHASSRERLCTGSGPEEKAVVSVSDRALDAGSRSAWDPAFGSTTATT